MSGREWEEPSGVVPRRYPWRAAVKFVFRSPKPSPVSGGGKRGTDDAPLSFRRRIAYDTFRGG